MEKAEASAPEETPAAPRHSVYNPHQLSDADLERTFIARRRVLDDIVRDVAAEAPESYPQHHLVCGQRGMGKTTLLRRVALELRRELLSRRFIPLTFPEDQYVEVDRLSKLWLNCLDALADALEQEGGQTAEVERVDDTVSAIDRPAADDATLEAAAREAFTEVAVRLGRRPVLLIDNFGPLLGRLKDDDYKLRGFFTAPGAPVIVAASVTPPDELQDYSAAFYDGFKTRVLRPLSLDEVRSVIAHLAGAAGRQEVLARLPAETPRLSALRDLTGGNPRTAVLLFDLFSRGFSEDAYEDLESLLDLMTPLYQSRLEQLSDQAQVIVGTLARHWRPATAATLSALARIPTSSLSPQLGRLEEMGLVEKTSAYPEKRSGYQIAERFFNIWYLMRFSTRRQRAGLAYLTRFIQEFHTPAQLERHARRLLSLGRLDQGRIPYAIALASALTKRPGLAYELETRAQIELVQQTRGIRVRIAEVLDPDEIDPRILSFAELQRRLREAAPTGCSANGEEFAALVLGSPAMLAAEGSGTATRHSVAASRLDAAAVEKVVQQLQTEREQLVSQYGAKAADWLASRLRDGLITSWNDPKEISMAVLDAEAKATVRILLAFADDRAKAGLSKEVFERVRSAVGPNRHANAEQWYNWGIALSSEYGRQDDAEAAFRKAISIDPGDAVAWHNLGVLLYSYLGRYDEAEAAFRKATELRPELVSAWNHLGGLLSRHLQRYDEAEAAYRKAIGLSPQHPYPWLNLGILLAEHLGRYEEAEAAYRRGIALDGQLARPWHELGDLLQSCLGRYEEAEAAYRKAIETDPGFADPHEALGNLLRRHLGRYEEAEAAFRNATELDPTAAGAWDGLGNLLADHFGCWGEARQAYERSLALHPENDTSRHNLAFLLRDFLGQSAEAHRVLRDLRDPETGRDTQALHEALFAAYEENWGTAVDALRRALHEAEFRLPPDTRDDWFRASAVLLHLGYGGKLVALLEAEGADVKMLPWFAAVSAHAHGDRRYLAGIPAESLPAAERIYDEVETRRKRLPPRRTCAAQSGAASSASPRPSPRVRTTA